MADGISLGELSRRLGRDKGGLSRLAKKGRIPRNSDGSYNLDAVVAALKSNTDPARAKPLPGDVDTDQPVNTDEYSGVRTAETLLKVEEREIRLRKLRGELVDKAKAAELFFTLSRRSRDAWLAWPARVAALIAAELQAEPQQVESILEQYVRQHLAELGEAAIEFH